MSLTPFVQHMRKLDGRATKRQYRESYISGKNLEYDVKGVEERLVGGEGEMSPQSNNSKSGVREKLYKSYNSSTSHGSSHTSGIESDSKQRNEADYEDEDEVEENDNAFVDDFDPIELDGPPSGGVICVTEKHLAAPQHKSLSVSDLTEQLPVVPAPVEERELSSTSETTHSELTVKGDCFDFPEPTVSKSEDDVMRDVTLASPVKERVMSPGVEKVTQSSNSYPSKVAHIKEASLERLPQPGALKHSLSHDALSYISSSEASAFSHVSARRDIPPTQLRGSRTYYDDMHTIPRQHKLSSSDSSKRTSVQHSSRRSKDGLEEKSRRHRHRKRSSRDHDVVGGRMQRSASTETGLHQSGGRHRNKSGGKRHHRHKSMHDAKDFADEVEIMVDPASPHFGAMLSAQKSVDDLADSTDSLLCRSDRHNNIPAAFEEKLIERLSSLPSPPTVPNPAEDAIESPSSHYRKMSDACQKTIAAQHRKLSDSKLP
uniref:Uncharacterized protein n=2 Tax=Ciona intestinalis TaxID=7719 RepID=F6XNH0_CIOIN